MTDSERGIAISKYVLLYSALYLVVYTLSTALSPLFNTNLGLYATAYFVGIYTSKKIIKENARRTTSMEKLKLIAGTFVFTLLINVILSSQVIGSRSLDHLNECFIPRQMILLLALWGILGPAYDHAYNSKK